MSNIELSDIFKTEYSNLVAVLCHHYGVQDIQSAEDIVSNAFMKAMKSWSLKGIPAKPKAWLRKVAVNELIDQRRREKVFSQKIKSQVENQFETDIGPITEEVLEDSQLRMLFVACHPTIGPLAQICISLRILCGFDIEEIARALLSNKSTINKRLYRAKQTIKKEKCLEVELTQEQYQARLDQVLKVIYLLFNEGYYSSVSEQNIRHDICWEAMRLCVLLSKQSYLPQQDISALLALMCFHASRLDARVSDQDQYLLFHQQNRNKWNTSLIEKGKQYLKSSAPSDKPMGKYHLEAAIAYWHTSDSDDKWEYILQLYNRLLTIEYSPIIAMNRTYALARANNVEQGIKESLKLGLEDNHYYYCLVAELYRMNADKYNEEKYLTLALQYVEKENERKLILEKLKLIN